SRASLPNIETVRFGVLCLLWYASSALTNNIGKQIMNAYRYPVTLTYVQFGFVAAFCAASARVLRMGRLRRPTRDVVRTTFPLAMFQIIGHVFSSVAISKVPVSVVHTIKALSPLFTVLIYRFAFQIPYPTKVYTSLIPLTLGVMLACTSSKLIFHVLGFFCALMSTLVFVVQNIAAKKIFAAGTATPRPDGLGTGRSSAGTGGPPAKLDKLNLLFYSSGLAFVLMTPLWCWSDGLSLLLYADPTRIPTARVTLLFLLNGITHFAQNVLAFWILSLVSPVTYSIASLLKRIFVIVAAMVWFGDAVSGRQAVGVGMAFLGLWLYDRAKGDVASGEARM
ncbi:triose-phosphate transporter family-domain-containing protein, partial [Blyttiomyces helicus]